MPPKPDIAVVGSASTDYVFKCEQLPDGNGRAEGRRFVASPGGKGVNQAIAAARLGVSAALLAKVGPDTRGRAIVQALAAEGVEIRHLLADSHDETGVSGIFVDEQGSTRGCTIGGANQKLSEADVYGATDMIAHSRVLLVQFEVPLPTVEAALSLAKSNGVFTILDPAPPLAMPVSFFQYVDLIKPNAREASVLTGVHVQDRETAREAADRLITLGVPAVLIQAGDDGNLLVTRKDELWLPHFQVTRIDTTGAGDAMAGAMAASIAKGRDLFHAALFANGAAAIATTQLGGLASFPGTDDVLELLNRDAEGGVVSIAESAA